jgi:hypothetical protein
MRVAGTLRKSGAGVTTGLTWQSRSQNGLLPPEWGYFDFDYSEPKGTITRAQPESQMRMWSCHTYLLARCVRRGRPLRTVRRRSGTMNPLRQLIGHGDSYWLDNLTRRAIKQNQHSCRNDAGHAPMNRRFIRKNISGVRTFVQRSASIQDGGSFTPVSQTMCRQLSAHIRISDSLIGSVPVRPRRTFGHSFRTMRPVE